MKIKTARFVFILTVISGILCAPHSSHADQMISAELKVIDTDHAEFEITYPVINIDLPFPVISSQKDGPLFVGHRNLDWAKGQDGTRRIISSSTDSSYDILNAKEGDISYTLHYSLTNEFNENDLSFFSFIVLTGGIWPTDVRFDISWPDGYELYSDSDFTKAPTTKNTKRFIARGSGDPTYVTVQPFFVLLHKKGGSHTIEKYKNYSYTSTGISKERISGAIDQISFLPEMFKKIFGVQNPTDIKIITANLAGANSAYQAEGIALPPDTILFDSSVSDQNLFGMNGAEATSLLIHEISHLTTTASIFGGRGYRAPWLDEGMAVFSQEYAGDTYFKPSASGTDSVYNHLASLKPSYSELDSMYSIPFDLNFATDTTAQPITKTYSHAGLIMYNLYMKDKSFFPKLFAQLKNTSSDRTCDTCDSDKALLAIRQISGMQTPDILTPYKGLTKQIPPPLALTDQQKSALKATTYRQVRSQTKEFLTSTTPIEHVDLLGNDTPSSVNTKTKASSKSATSSQQSNPMGTSTVTQPKNITREAPQQPKAATVDQKNNNAPEPATTTKTIAPAPKKAEKSTWTKIVEWAKNLF